AGGFRIAEPAADLAVAAALLSAFTGQPVPGECVAFGEIGLSGEIRRVSQPDLRLKEAAKLGFSQAIMPMNDAARKTSVDAMIKRTELRHLKELLALFDAAPMVKKR